MGEKLSTFLARSRRYNQTSVDASNIRVKNFSNVDGGYLVEFVVLSATDSAKMYNVSIWLSKKEINMSTEIKMHCDCPSFKFQYSAVLATKDCLYGEPEVDKLPKKPQLGVCKHLRLALNFLTKFKNLEYIERLYKK